MSANQIELAYLATGSVRVIFGYETADTNKSCRCFKASKPGVLTFQPLT